MIEETQTVTPADLRLAAELVESGEETPLGASLREKAAGLRGIAANLERRGAYSVVRPAVRVIYRLP
jgi:hypothetical protein